MLAYGIWLMEDRPGVGCAATILEILMILVCATADIDGRPAIAMGIAWPNRLGAEVVGRVILPLFFQDGDDLFGEISDGDMALQARADVGRMDVRLDSVSTCKRSRRPPKGMWITPYSFGR